MQKSRFYWIAQIVGWSAFFTVNFFYALKNTYTKLDVIYYILLVPSAILLTHLYRWLVIRNDWLRKTVLNQLMIAIISGYALSILFLTIQYFLNLAIFGTASELSLLDSAIQVISFWFVFFLWNVFYYFYQYTRNLRKVEIQQLKMKATLKEAELNKLKSQLNPHFMFNAMNSIRALIDEDPKKAKEAVTKLSSILRQTLTLEKNKLIPFDREMQLVKDYLDLEKIRFEERLHCTYDIHAGSHQYNLPPMILQTLVENAIKHGISNLTQGGMITIKTEMLKGKKMQIEISNSGTYNPEITPQSGYGIKNTRDRLAHVFADDASFSIFNEKFFVKTQIVIPLYKTNN
ncbi:MAG TPA: histidine kinase [Bacteroidia bacterium]|jgi:two-component system LytT family sensor kinase|nr:histidine kinase [Bacteroidia bacterium]